MITIFEMNDMVIMPRVFRTLWAKLCIVLYFSLLTCDANAMHLSHESLFINYYSSLISSWSSDLLWISLWAALSCVLCLPRSAFSLEFRPPGAQELPFKKWLFATCVRFSSNFGNVFLKYTSKYTSFHSANCKVNLEVQFVLWILIFALYTAFDHIKLLSVKGSWICLVLKY